MLSAMGAGNVKAYILTKIKLPQKRCFRTAARIFCSFVLGNYENLTTKLYFST